MKRNVVSKILVLAISASMLLGSTSVFAETLETQDTAQEEVTVDPDATEQAAEDVTEDQETTVPAQEAVADEETVADEDSLAKSSGGTTVSYRTHVQTYGWQDYVSNGTMSGTEGQAKRLEGINIKLENQEYEGGITYRTHVQTYGWQDYVSNDAMAGTEGEAKRLEAIQIELTGEMADHYDVYYRVHSQTYGWLGWAKNGEKAGSSNYAKRLEGIQIVLVEKGGEAPGSTEGAYVHPWVGYNTHVQTYGWQGFKFDGDTAGTSGQAKRLEGIQLKLVDQPYEGSIQYKTHVQTYGWQDWTSDGATAGTTGEAKRLEAIQIQLTGEMADHFDVYYRVHSQTYGWLGWAKNGESAGTEGFGKRLEAIEVVLVEKGNEAPSSDIEAFKKAEDTQNDEASVWTSGVMACQGSGYVTVTDSIGWSHTYIFVDGKSYRSDRLDMGEQYPVFGAHKGKVKISFVAAPHYALKESGYVTINGNALDSTLIGIQDSGALISTIECDVDDFFVVNADFEPMSKLNIMDLGVTAEDWHLDRDWDRDPENAWDEALWKTLTSLCGYKD